MASKERSGDNVEGSSEERSIDEYFGLLPIDRDEHTPPQDRFDPEKAEERFTPSKVRKLTRA